MSPDKKIVWQHPSPHFNRPFLQPLAVGLVCAIFIVLILFMGIMDIHRSDRTLIGFMEDQGERIIEVVERLTEENLKTMISASQKAAGGPSVPLSEQVFTPQKFLTDEIIAMGREIDQHWKKEHLSESYIRKYAEEKKLWLVAVLNSWGDVIFQSRPVPENRSGEKGPTINGIGRTGAELIDRLNHLNRLKKIGFIALSRKDKSGTIIIALDIESLRYWGRRVSVEKALEKLGEGQGIVYLTVRDKNALPLGKTGVPPTDWKETNPLLPKILSGTVPMESHKVNIGEKNLLEIVAPLRIGGEIAGVVRLGLDRGNTDQILEKNRRNMFIFLAFVVVIALLSMWLLYQNQNRHLAGIVEMTRELEKAERLSSLGQLAAGVAHEIRNPLSSLKGFATYFRQRYGGVPDDVKMADIMIQEVDRLNRVITELLEFSRPVELKRKTTDAASLVRHAADTIERQAREKGVVLRTEIAPGLPPVLVDPDRMTQVLLNLFLNALAAMERGGVLSVGLALQDGRTLRITVGDTGTGIRKEDLGRVFDPYFTTKPSGTGLGLAIVHRIIESHGGEIRLESEPGRGTVFTILLPVGAAGKEHP